MQPFEFVGSYSFQIASGLLLSGFTPTVTKLCLIMTMVPDVLLDSNLLGVCDNKCPYLQVYMYINRLGAIYHYAVIGLIHIMEGVLAI